MKRILGLMLLFLASSVAAGTVVGSKHDLSARGPGPYRARTERDPCIFCHIAHGSGSSGLSNIVPTTAQHRPYESTTLRTRPGAPSGASRLCLSCHDGTIALGRTRTGIIAMEKGNDPLDRSRPSNLGTDLRKSHPVSMAASSTSTRPPRRGDAVHLDGAALVQCTSCHDPHDEWRDPDVGKFLVKPSAKSAICLSCHEDRGGLDPATHVYSNAKYPDPDPASQKKLDGGTPEKRAGSSGARARTMADVGCAMCHVPHDADSRGRLLKDGATDDGVCLACHGKTTRTLVSLDLAKASAHVAPKGQHDAAEGPDATSEHKLPEVSATALRHVTCVDCHDPHRSNPRQAIVPALPGALAGVWGINIDGKRVSPARREYEICFKCHADSANKPQAMNAGAPPIGRVQRGMSRANRWSAASAGSLGSVRRANADANLRLVFDPNAPSFHPVAAPGKSRSVPGLLSPYSPSSLVLCTGCHASDTGPGAGGEGARGPHGSAFKPILERQYLTGDGTPESPASYALCYKCHDRDALLSDTAVQISAFRDASGSLHRRHVVDEAAPCSACHVAHGVSRQAGNDRNNAHLISFDLSIVEANQGIAPVYETAGTGHGSCNLTCHGVDHPRGPARLRRQTGRSRIAPQSTTIGTY